MATSSGASTNVSKRTDWNKCCLCQKETNEGLVVPNKNLNRQVDDGYALLGRNIPKFHLLNQLPIRFDPFRLDNGMGIEETLRRNNAKFHKGCRLLFNNTKLERVEKRLMPSSTDSGSSSKIPRKVQDIRSPECFFCGKEGGEIRQAQTDQLDKSLNRCAKNLCDTKLFAKLSAGDASAQEFKYHPVYLTALCNRERAYLVTIKHEEEQEATNKTQHAYPVAFSELVTYISEMRDLCTSDEPPIFRLAELSTLYKERLIQLGITEPEIHSTRLKDRLLLHIPDLKSHRKGRDIYLAFEKDVGSLLAEVGKFREAIHIAKAAEMIRRDMLEHKSTFNATLPADCLDEAIPASLLQFVSMLEHGADIKSQMQHGSSKSDHSLAQLLQYNCTGKSKAKHIHRHSKERETPFAVYIGLSVFSKTRKKQIIELLYENGLSISYDRVLEISTLLGEAAVARFVEEGVVCPPILRKGVFTTAAVDNIDHNPSSTTAKSSFHGTSMSVFQHPSQECPGEERMPLLLHSKTAGKKIPELPETYTNVKPAYIRENPTPPQLELNKLPSPVSMQSHLTQEFTWLESVSLTETVDNAVNVTWASHHAAQLRSQKFDISISSLLPLLRDQAHNVATTKHSMEKIRDTVAFLNPGQTPVIAAEQPLFAIAKQIQWKWPEYGEAKFAIMFGGLHIEMAALRSVGTLLKDSGWASALTEAEVTTSGTAESYLSASHATKTRMAHQITASSLYTLMKEAHVDYASQDNTQIMSFADWRAKRQLESPQFKFWNMVLDIELIIFMVIRSFREGNFSLYCESLYQLLPYFLPTTIPIMPDG